MGVKEKLRNVSMSRMVAYATGVGLVVLGAWKRELAVLTITPGVGLIGLATKWPGRQHRKEGEDAS